jgi:hypothetical protein
MCVAGEKVLMFFFSPKNSERPEDLLVPNRDPADTILRPRLSDPISEFLVPSWANYLSQANTILYAFFPSKTIVGVPACSLMRL